jgi:hypothetical protein
VIRSKEWREMLTKYVSDEQWKKEAVYEVGDVVYNTITVSGDKGVYSAGSKFRICDIQADTSTRNLKEYDVSRFVTKYVSFILASEETDDLIRCQAGDFRLYHEGEKMKESNLAIQLLAVGSVLLILMILTVIVIAVFFDKNNRIAWSVAWTVCGIASIYSAVLYLLSMYGFNRIENSLSYRAAKKEKENTNE